MPFLQLFSAFQVKHEVLEDEEREMDRVIQEAEGSSSPNSKPFYETSMLARSLLSGWLNIPNFLM